MEKILLYLKTMQAFRWIIVDAGHRMDEITLKALELSDILVLVTSPSVPALTNTKKWLELLQLLGLELSMEIWLNSWNKNTGLTLSEVSSYLGGRYTLPFPTTPKQSTGASTTGSPWRRPIPAIPCARGCRSRPRGSWAKRIVKKPPPPAGIG